MTLSPWLVYLWGNADQIHFVFTFVLFASAIGLAVLALMGLFLTEEKAETETWALWRKWAKVCILSFIFAGVGKCLMPSSKTVAIMVIAPAIVNSDPIQKDLPEIYNAAVDALKEQLKK